VVRPARPRDWPEPVINATSLYGAISPGPAAGSRCRRWHASRRGNRRWPRR
jgi:hypothetical protein